MLIPLYETDDLNIELSHSLVGFWCYKNLLYDSADYIDYIGSIVPYGLALSTSLKFYCYWDFTKAYSFSI